MSDLNLSISKRGWRCRPAAACLLVFLVLLLSGTAHADALARPTKAAALERFTTGNRLYRIREFAKAIEEYKAGVLVEETPVFHYNLAQSYRQLGRYEEAIWHYERFMKLGQPTGEFEAGVQKFLADLRNELQQRAASRSSVEPDPEPVAQPAATAPKTPPSPSVSSVDEQSRGMTRQRKLAIGVGAGGVALVGLGIALGVSAKSLEDDAAAICPTISCDRAEESNALIDRGKTRALYANVSFGVGAGAIVGAAVLWLTSSSTQRAKTALVPMIAPSSIGAAASVRF